MVRRYRIEHRTVYRYSDEVSTSFGRGYLQPRDLPGQRCLQHTLSIEPTPSDLSHGVDVYGNYNTLLPRHQLAHRTAGDGAVRGRGAARPILDPAVLAQPWERARPSSTADPRAVEFTLASPLVRMPVPIRRVRGRVVLAGPPDHRRGERPDPPDPHRVQVRVRRDLGVLDRHRRAGGEEGCLPGLRARRHRVPALHRAGLPVRLRLPGHLPAARASRG